MIKQCRENAAANLVAMQVENENLKSSYYRDLKNGYVSEHKQQYPPQSKAGGTSMISGEKMHLMKVENYLADVKHINHD